MYVRINKIARMNEKYYMSNSIRLTQTHKDYLFVRCEGITMINDSHPRARTSYFDSLKRSNHRLLTTFSMLIFSMRICMLN